MTVNTRWLWLTAPIALLLAIAAGSGVFASGFYARDPAFVIPQLVGQDLLSLVLALPALVAAAYFAGRGSLLALIVWLGVLSYLVYSYALFAFGVRFNALFLVYSALLGCSLYALIGGLATADLGAIKAGFRSGAPARGVSIFLAVMAALYYFLWLGQIVPAMVSGAVPQSVLDFETPTNGVHVLDTAIVLPALILTAVWLWQGRPIGYALAGVLLVKMLTLGLALLSMTAYSARSGIAVQPELTATYGVMTAASLGMLVWFASGMRGGGRS